MYDILRLIFMYGIGIIVGGFIGAMLLTTLVLWILDLFPDLKLYLLNGDLSGYLALAILIMVYCTMIGVGVGIITTYYLLRD
jgi:hypothetical protein